MDSLLLRGEQLAHGRRQARDADAVLLHPPGQRALPTAGQDMGSDTSFPLSNDSSECVGSLRARLRVCLTGSAMSISVGMRIAAPKKSGVKMSAEY